MPPASAATDAVLAARFARFDTNADGVVDFTEFRILMDELGNKTGKKYNALQLRVRRAWGTAKTATMLSTAVRGFSSKGKEAAK